MQTKPYDEEKLRQSLKSDWELMAEHFDALSDGFTIKTGENQLPILDAILTKTLSDKFQQWAQMCRKQAAIGLDRTTH